jgi:hypothetical protein
MLHIGFTFPAVMTNTIPGTSIREPHGNNIYVLLQRLLMLQASSLCLGLIMALMKLIIQGIGPPLLWGLREEPFNRICGN